MINLTGAKGTAVEPKKSGEVGPDDVDLVLEDRDPANDYSSNKLLGEQAVSAIGHISDRVTPDADEASTHIAGVSALLAKKDDFSNRQQVVTPSGSAAAADNNGLIEMVEQSSFAPALATPGQIVQEEGKNDNQ